MSTTQSQWSGAIVPEDLYRILIDTRNLEVNLFWQRANYFLVLNSGIVLAIFNVTKAIPVRVFAVIGILASLLWFWACLASKYWQTFWAERLAEFERKNFAGLDFFSANRKTREFWCRNRSGTHTDHPVNHCPSCLPVRDAFSLATGRFPRVTWAFAWRTC